MDIVRELERVKLEMDRKQNSLAGQLRSEFSRFSGNTQTVLNSIDEKIAERVREEVGAAFSEIKTLISNLKLRGA